MGNAERWNNKGLVGGGRPPARVRAEDADGKVPPAPAAERRVRRFFRDGEAMVLRRQSVRFDAF